MENLVSFYHKIITGESIPSFDWRISNDTIYAAVDAGSTYEIRLWEACNETDRDFKIYVIGEEAWQMEVLDVNDQGIYAVPVTEPETGFKAALVEVIFNPDAEFPLTLTSGTLITPDCYPFDPFEPDLSIK